MSNWQRIIVASAVMALAACGGGGGSSSSEDKQRQPSPPSPGTSESGRVIDGYLESARVCIDTNSNNRCDNNESPLFTDAQGRFNLTGLSGKALLAQAVAGLTKDADDGGAAVNQGFILMAPANHNGIINPFTTLMVAMQKNGDTAQEASGKLQRAFGSTAQQLSADYVANSDSQIQKLAKTLVLTVQESSRRAMNASDNPGAIQAVVETLAWSQINEAAMTDLTQKMQQNPDATAALISASWLNDQQQLLMTPQEIEGGNNGGGNGGGGVPSDRDNDTVPDTSDNCPTVANRDQANNDNDAQGDACDSDDDNDSVEDTADNCPVTANTNQLNTDNDAQGNACDTDDDNDTVEDTADNCPVTANSDQADRDNNGIGNACDFDDDSDNVTDDQDNCPLVPNEDQANNDNDAQGDACDTDDDNDRVLDETDNCPMTSNPDQNNNDNDAQGDACDSDDDNDNVEDSADNCPMHANADQNDRDNNNIGDACDVPLVINAAPESVTINDDDDTLTFVPNDAHPSLTDYQYRVGSGAWIDFGDNVALPVNVGDRAEGIASVRVKPQSLNEQSTAKDADTQFTRTPLVKLDRNLNRLANNALSVDDNGEWACTRDNRNAETIYWVTTKSYHQGYSGSGTYGNQLSTLEDINDGKDYFGNSVENCGFNNWGLPTNASLRSLASTDLWGEAPYFGFMRKEGKGYFILEKDNSDNPQALNSDGQLISIVNQFTSGFLMPSRRIQPASDILARLTTQTSQIDDLKTDADTLITNLQSQYDAAISAYNAATTREDFEALDAINPDNGPLRSARRSSDSAVRSISNIIRDAQNLKPETERLARILTNNVDLNVSVEQSAQAQAAFEAFNTKLQLLENIQQDILNQQGTLYAKTSLTEIRVNNFIVSGIQQSNSNLATPFTTNAATLTQQKTDADTLQDFINLNSAISAELSAIGTALENLGSPDTQSNWRDNAPDFGRAKYARSESSDAVSVINNNSFASEDDKDLATATHADTLSRYDNLVSVYSTIIIAQNTINILRQDITAVTNGPIAVNTASAENRIKLSTALTDTSTGVTDLTNAIETISDATAGNLYNSAQSLFSVAENLRTELDTLKQNLTSVNSFIADNQFTSGVTESLTQLRAELTEAINNAQAGYDAAISKAREAYDAAWNNNFSINREAALIGDTAFAKLDFSGRYMPSASKTYQGWSCVENTPTLRTEKRTWSLLNTEEVQSGMTFPEASAFVVKSNNKSLCGHNDWGLPSISELQSLPTTTFGFSDTPRIDNDVFPYHLGNSLQYLSSSDTDARYNYWSNEANPSEAGEQKIYAYGGYFWDNENYDSYSQVPALASAVKDASLPDNWTIAPRLYRQTEKQLTIRKLSADGTVLDSAATDFSCLQIENDIWMMHSAYPDSTNISASSITSTLILMNNQKICGLNTWDLPSQQQLTGLAQSASDVGVTDFTSSDYWLKETDIGGDHYYFDVTDLTRSSWGTSFGSYSMRVVTTAP